jgi:ABC-2 type transport system permease protein
MRRASFLRLLGFEIEMFARDPATWVVLALLTAAMVWGAFNGQRHVQSQQAAVARIHQREADAIAWQKATARRFMQPSTLMVPYWQDPTDVAGYMRYGLTSFAVKPPSVLGALAIGQSNVVPFYLRARLDFISPPEAAYEFENPRGLAIGAFDLAFVLIYLLPLALIALAAWRLSSERDSGALRLIASQPSSARAIVASKFGAVAIVSIPAVLAGTWLALALAGVPILRPRLLAIEAIVTLGIAGYAAFWIALAASVAPRTGAIASASTLVARWMVLLFVVPAMDAFAVGALHPTPSRLRYLDALRRESDATDKRRDALVTAYLAARPAYKAAVGRIAALPYATKQIAVQTELEERLRSRTEAFDRARASAARTAAVLRLLSPGLVVDALLQAAAGSDAVRHESFLRRSRQHTDWLRAFFWPRALLDAAQPAVRSCRGCPAKMSFTSYDEIPKFAEDDPLTGIVPRIGWMALYLWLITVGVALFAAHRRQWTDR